MSPKSTIMARKSSRKKGVASLEARKRPKTTSGPQLGTYGRKKLKVSLTPGHKAVLRRGTATPVIRTLRPRTGPMSRADREFLIFCIKHILTSTNLVIKEGVNWRLRESIAGVNSGEAFTSLDACAASMVASLEAQYQERVVAAA